MNDLLEQLIRVQGVGGCLLLSEDGLPIASQLRSDVDEEALAASIADVMARALRLGQQAALGAGTLHVAGSKGSLALTPLGDNLLALIIDPSANMALLMLDTQPIITALDERLAT